MERQKIYTKEEFVALIDRIGCNSGGEIEVTGLNGGENFSIIVAQTEWYDTPVCFVGGYGNSVVAIDCDEVAGKLPAVLDDYFDKDSVFTVKEISVDLSPESIPEDDNRIEVCECCGGRNIVPEPCNDGWNTPTWCPDCEEEHHGTNLKEYKETIDAWWDSLDEATAERLSLGAEDRQTWWHSLTFDQQRALYKKTVWDGGNEFQRINHNKTWH